MTDPDEDFAPPPPRPRGRWLRKVMLCLLGLCAAVALVLVLGRWQVGRIGQRQLQVETARLDADDPGWKLDAILAAHKKAELPPAENAADAVLEVAEGIPDDWNKWRNSEDAVKVWVRQQNHRLPTPDQIEMLRQHAADTHLIRTQAIRLRDKKGGAFALTIPSDPYSVTLPHLDKCRRVLSLLEYDAYLAAIEKNPSRGISAARAALAVSRAIGAEPFLVSQLVRLACCSLSARVAMQVMAWGEPTEGLAELQAELLAEAEVPFFRTGIRGERAVIDRMFTGLADGTIPAEHWFRYADIGQPGPQHYAAFRSYKALIPGDHAKALELYSLYVKAANLPHHEQLAAMKAVPIPPGPPEEFRYIVTRLMIPAADRVAEAGLRVRAELLCAALGVACERFRQKSGRWPNDPAELVPAFFPSVPTNPFDGKPISYRTFPDRVAIYCYWADAPRKVNDLPDDFRAGNPPGAAYGYRLWNPDRRGLPAEEMKDP